VLNDGNTFIIPRNAPSEVTPPRIDHIAYTIAGWNQSAVEVELNRRRDPTPTLVSISLIRTVSTCRSAAKGICAYG
jgi:hypothetical protein